MILAQTTDKESFLDRLKQLAQQKFAARAALYDRTASFPQEDFTDLFNAGLHAPAVPLEYGGLGLSHSSDIYSLWMMTKAL
ncbi:acyl-CoA dehydrogenase family protein, partial [Spirulina sp. 06S082]|uniref:acyl-CoA dehydrogenase family protein n=1 Tax=Spirulina sp. 06S082 TaxID=3110248 RepID=UPI002B1EF3F9